MDYAVSLGERVRIFEWMNVLMVERCPNLLRHMMSISSLSRLLSSSLLKQKIKVKQKRLADIMLAFLRF